MDKALKSSGDHVFLSKQLFSSMISHFFLTHDYLVFYDAKVKLENRFTNSELVYMHCDVNVCIETEENSCEVECSKSRSPRSTSSYAGQNVVSLGPIRFTGYSKAEYLIIDPATGLVDEQEEMTDITIDAEFNFINHFLIALITLVTMVMLVAVYGATRKCPTEDSTLA